MRCFAPATLATLLALSAVSLLACAPAARAASPSEQYLWARRNYPPRPGMTLEVAAQKPDACRGLTLEVSGRLLGIARTDDGASLMLSTEKGEAINLQMTEAPAWAQPGDRLRALVVVAGKPAGTTIGLPDLQVVAIASASDVAAAEARLRAQAASAKSFAPKRSASSRSTGRSASKSAARMSRSSGGSGARSAPDGRTSLMSRYLSADARSAYGAYRSAIRAFNPKLSNSQADTITTSVLLFSERMGVDARLVVALIIAESSFDPSATSRVGAMGLGQIMPGTAREIGLTDPYDPVQNIAGAVYLLRSRLDKYSGGKDLTMNHVILALAAYNAGPGAVKKHGGVPPYRETRNYVKKVEKIYRQLCGQG